MSPDQRERMAAFSLSGATEGPDLWLARQRLEFGRDLAEHGRITESVKVAPCGAERCQGHVVEDERPSEQMIERAVAIARERPRVAPPAQPAVEAAGAGGTGV